MGDATVSYELVSTPEWGEAIRETFRFEASGDAWDYVGSCPRCRHPIAKRLQMGGTNTFRAPGDANRSGMLVRCNCDSQHEGRPDGSKGCGAYGTLELEWS